MAEEWDVQAWLERADGEQIPIEHNLSFGRTSGNDVVLPEERVSRRHAILHVQGEGEFWLVDLGSRNGTYVNERRIHQPMPLHDGDKLCISAFVFTFRQQGKSLKPGETSTQTGRTLLDIRQAACWLLVGDVAHSTSLAQSLSAEELAVTMGRWFLRCKTAVELAQGTMNKYLGDGFLAFWTEAMASPPALVRLIASFQEYAREAHPQFRFVLHRGEVFLGGVATMGEENLSGPAVNFVFRMEKVAAGLGLGCLLSEAASQGLEGVLPTQPAGEHLVPGFEGPHRFFTLA
jgi:adenylate cyclase